MSNNFKYIFGPVFSWRLGMSLGIDPLSAKEKVCSFDCIYCQLSETDRLTKERKDFAPVEDIIHEIKSLPEVHIDYLTFSGRGEPTLAKNLGEMIKAVRKERKERIAVITNSSLIDREDVQKDLCSADFVLAKLDVPDQEMFKKINRPVDGIEFDRMIEGIKTFKKSFKGRLGLQIMFVEENKDCVHSILEIVKEISPDEVQINTPLRPCGVTPLAKNELESIKSQFKGLPIICVYDTANKEVTPFEGEKTVLRHGTVDSPSRKNP